MMGEEKRIRDDWRASLRVPALLTCDCCRNVVVLNPALAMPSDCRRRMSFVYLM